MEVAELKRRIDEACIAIDRPMKRRLRRGWIALTQRDCEKRPHPRVADV
jgi:hypothetical protein